MAITVAASFLKNGISWARRRLMRRTGRSRCIDTCNVNTALDVSMADALILGHGRLRSWLLTAPILARDAVGPSTPTVREQFN